MSVYGIRLIWKRDNEDIELGKCYDVTRPVVGELITYSHDLGVTWKVVLVEHKPFMEGSVTWNTWIRTFKDPASGTYYWVEPVEGPWEP